MNLRSPKQNSESSGENVSGLDQSVEACGIGDVNSHSKDGSGDRSDCRTMWDPGTWKEMEIGRRSVSRRDALVPRRGCAAN